MQVEQERTLFWLKVRLKLHRLIWPFQSRYLRIKYGLQRLKRNIKELYVEDKEMWRTTLSEAIRMTFMYCVLPSAVVYLIFRLNILDYIVLNKPLLDGRATNISNSVRSRLYMGVLDISSHS